jgi:two-component system nitrate/nitrite response regulator NarL
MNPIRVLLLDDHALFREGLARILRALPEFTIVRATATVAEAMGVLESQSVDVILLDLELKGESGIDMLRRAKEFGFRGTILVVAADVSQASERKLVDQGAAGVFLKSDPPEMLIDYIHRAREGEMATKQ